MPGAVGDAVGAAGDAGEAPATIECPVAVDVTTIQTRRIGTSRLALIVSVRINDAPSMR